MFDFREHPGLLFVYATLLPLASFLFLLLAGALRALARTRRESGLGAALYEALGGDTPRKTGAYIATGAIFLSFVLSLIGFIQHLPVETQREELEEGIIAAAKKHDEEKANQKERQVEELDDQWSGQTKFIRLWQDSKKGTDPQRGVLLQLGYRIDNLTTIMFLMVTFIATLIHLFSIGYMSEELQPTVEDHQVHTADGHLRRRGRFGRFFMFLSLFCFSMLNLVLADNLFQVFISWELVGICSYLLIGFYYERTSASNAANKAFITNRVGDAGFILGVLILWTHVGTLNFHELFHHVRAPVVDSHHDGEPLAGEIVRANPVAGSEREGSYRLKVTNKTQESAGSEILLFPKYWPGHYHGPQPGQEVRVQTDPKWNDEKPKRVEYGSMPYWLLVAAGLGIFLGCVGKSAQFPLQVWLPDAMEGPTPVSALIHAATMVAAGVYLVGRCFPLFTPESRLVIAYTGAITLFVAATIAIVMTDIKKVLAYSTVSQLGFMMLALGVGGWIAGLFHLLTHAFFKALLFLGSGSVIYGCHHEQEMTKMGGLYPKMRITAITMLIGVLAIAGTPLFSGWYSKDAIIAQALGFVYVHPEHFLLLLLPLVTAAITTFYMFRMWFMTFTGKPRDHHVYEHAHESPWLMTVPLMILAFFTLVVAWGLNPIDPESSFMGKHIHHAQHDAVTAEFGRIPHKNEKIWHGGQAPVELIRERHWAFQYHTLAELLALLASVLGVTFAGLLYYFRVLDPAEAREQFPAVHRFLQHKWYFDEWYSAIVVRPALAAAGWCRAFDTHVIDGIANSLGRFSVWVAKWDGRFDNFFIDGLANLIGDGIYETGHWLRHVQTGYIRSYVLFLVLAAIGIFAVLSYFVAMASLAATG